MLEKILLEKFETLVIPIEEHNVVLLGLLKGLNSFGSHSLDFLVCRLELLVLLHSQLLLNLQVVNQSLSLLLGGISFIHSKDKIPP